jgi:hypothetical protein
MALEVDGGNVQGMQRFISDDVWNADQMRTLLEVVLPLRTYTIEDVLKLVAWVQRRNHRAYLSHRKRRETEG